MCSAFLLASLGYAHQQCPSHTCVIPQQKISLTLVRYIHDVWIILSKCMLLMCVYHPSHNLSTLILTGEIKLYSMSQIYWPVFFPPTKWASYCIPKLLMYPYIPPPIQLYLFNPVQESLTSYSKKHNPFGLHASWSSVFSPRSAKQTTYYIYIFLPPPSISLQPSPTLNTCLIYTEHLNYMLECVVLAWEPSSSSFFFFLFLIACLVVDWQIMRSEQNLPVSILYSLVVTV